MCLVFGFEHDAGRFALVGQIGVVSGVADVVVSGLHGGEVLFFHVYRVGEGGGAAVCRIGHGVVS